MFVLHTFRDLILFAAAVFGLGSALAPRWSAEPLLRLAFGAAAALGVQFGVGFLGYISGCSNVTSALLTAGVAGVLWMVRGRASLALLRETEVRQFLGAWAVFCAWSLGLLALVVSYSGGGWGGDWVEHWQRTRFFMERQPTDTLFLGMYTLTSRPPLVNVVVALWLEATAGRFGDHQVFMMLLSSSLLLPTWILARHFRPRASTGWWVVLLLMLSPLVAQNLTFAWTKLPTAFFVLTAMVLLLPSLSAGATGPSPLGAALCLGLGLLSHYSAGPWVVALAIGYLVARRSSWREAAFWRQMVAAAVVLAVVLTIWLGWSALRFGWQGTTGTTSTATTWSTQSTADRVAVPLRNIRDTLIPFPLRGEPQDGLISQTSRVGRVRDVAFSLYQVNLPLAFGLGGLMVLTTLAVRRWTRDRTSQRSSERTFFILLIPLVIVLGIVVHTPRDQWGLTHICLQPLVLLGLARIAAALPDLPRGVRIAWGLLVAVDAAFGIVLHFGLQSWALARWVAPGGDALAYLQTLNPVALGNARDKVLLQLEFFADRVPLPPAAVGLWLALCVAWVILRLRQAPSGSS